MSMNVSVSVSPRAVSLGPLAAALVGAAAVGFVLAVLFGVSWLLGASAPVRQAPNPFGLPTREVGGGGGGLAGAIMALQAQFHMAMTALLTEIRAGTSPTAGIALLGFVYGVVHAAGPGHGKGVIGSYIVARDGSAALAVGLSTAAAMLQALVAIAIVGLFMTALSGMSFTVADAARFVEMASFLAIAAMGLLLTWRKSREVLTFATGVGHEPSESGTPAGGTRYEWLFVIVAAGIRPCSGALLLLVFSLSQGLFLAGVLGALAMAAGTALTTSTIACVASVVRRAGARHVEGSPRAEGIVALVELLAAAFVLVFGLVMTFGTAGARLPGLLD